MSVGICPRRLSPRRIVDARSLPRRLHRSLLATTPLRGSFPATSIRSSARWTRTPPTAANISGRATQAFSPGDSPSARCSRKSRARSGERSRRSRLPRWALRWAGSVGESGRKLRPIEPPDGNLAVGAGVIVGRESRSARRELPGNPPSPQFLPPRRTMGLTRSPATHAPPPHRTGLITSWFRDRLFDERSLWPIVRSSRSKGSGHRSPSTGSTSTEELTGLLQWRCPRK